MSLNAVDITEKLANENKIVAQYHSLREIAYIHSHQLRKPASSIIGLMNLFKSNGYTTTKEGLRMLEKAVKDLEAQIKKIEGYAA
jgi:light-regulated signal transduction histidine kinase (bacteriophytochrome)